MGTETELHERITISGAEEASAKIGRVYAAAERVSQAFGRIAAIGASVAGIGGAWRVVETIHELDDLYRSVKLVRAVTGETAQNSFAMLKMFKMSGIEMDGALRTITSLARLSGKMGDGVAESAEQAQKLQQIMKSLGVGIKAGPEERILAMSKAAADGRLKINDLVTGFGIMRSQAAPMLAMLQRGPAELKKDFDAALKSGAVIDEKALESYNKMVKARRELKEAWEDTVGVLYKKLIPGITTALQYVAKHLDHILAVAKALMAMKLANNIANVLTGNNMSIAGRGLGAVGRVAGFFGRSSAAAGAADYFGAKAMSPGVGMFGKAGGGILGAASSGLSSIFGSLGGVVTRVISIVGRFGPWGLAIAAVLAVLWQAFKMFQNNFMGIKDYVVKTFSDIFERLKSIGQRLWAVLLKLWEAIQPIVKLVGAALLISLAQFAWMLDKIVTVIDWAAKMIVAIFNGVIWALNKIPGVNIDYIDMDAKDKAAATADDSKRETGEGSGSTYQDFRGSKFEINNNFPQGIDGGRVAVAFGDELAALGERRLDAGVRPLYSYR